MHVAGRFRTTFTPSLLLQSRCRPRYISSERAWRASATPEDGPERRRKGYRLEASRIGKKEVLLIVFVSRMGMSRRIWQENDVGYIEDSAANAWVLQILDEWMHDSSTYCVICCFTDRLVCPTRRLHASHFGSELLDPLFPNV
jgi:hypothetical protein